MRVGSITSRYLKIHMPRYNKNITAIDTANALATAIPRPSIERSKSHHSKADVIATNTNR